MKRTVIVTVMSEDEKLSCSERFEWDTATAIPQTLLCLTLSDAERKLHLLEAKGPWKKAPAKKG